VLVSQTVPVSNMRRTIARRLVESKTTIPHFTATVTVDMDALLGLRATLNDQLAAAAADGQAPVKLSVNDFLVRASALALVRHPGINSSWSDNGILQHGTVNIGVAVALPAQRGGGLVVPTIRHAHLKGLRQISVETRALAEKARGQGQTIEEMSDGTFTLSNLGMYGIDHFEANINPPQAAILAVGAAAEKPVVRGGQVAVGPVMTATLSADHRVVDGAMAGEWLATLRQLIENPAVLLV
jgi:pyruvate dehydrogenase E2 component (dihydrolipoamide acetyltransferase)